MNLFPDRRIIFQLCLDPTNQEPAYLCFWPARPPVTVQYAVTNARSARNISMVVYVARFSSTGLLYLHEHVSNRYLSTDSAGSVLQWDKQTKLRCWFCSEVSCHDRTCYRRLVRSEPNTQCNPFAISRIFWYLFIRSIHRCHSQSGRTLVDVFERSNASLAFQISVGYYYNGCAVIGDQLYLLTDTTGMKSVNIANRTGATMTNWTIGTYRPGWTDMVVDSSGRFYTACSSCGLTTTCMGYSVCGMISDSSNNTLLAVIGDY